MVLQALGITQKFHIQYCPQSLGKVEQMNHTIKEALRKIVNQTGKDWPKRLLLILTTIRSSDRL